MVGPVQCGKSALANHLADFQAVPSGEYGATAGVRILEFEKEVCFGLAQSIN